MTKRELEKRRATVREIMSDYYARKDLAARQAAIEAEQARQAKELEKQRREQERLRKEQERQAEQLAKHEKRLAELEFRARQARGDIDFLTERIAQLDAQRDFLLLQQTATLPGSKVFESCQRKILTLDNQIHAAERKKSKAAFDLEQARKGLSA